MKYLILFLSGFCLILSSCVSQKGVEKYNSRHPEFLQVQSEAFLNDHPEVLAQKCTEKFPVRERLVQGATVIVRDTIPGPVIPCPPSGNVKCPDSYNKTSSTLDTSYLEDTAKLYALEARYQDSLQARQVRFDNKYQSEHDARLKVEMERDRLQVNYNKVSSRLKQLSIGAVLLIVFFLLYFFTNLKKLVTGWL